MSSRHSSLLCFSLGSLSLLLILLALHRLMRPPQYVALPKRVPAPHPQDWCEPRSASTGLPLVHSESGNEPEAAWERDEGVHPLRLDQADALARPYGWPRASDGSLSGATSVIASPNSWVR